MRACSKFAGVGPAIEAKLLALLEGLLQASLVPLQHLSNVNVVADSIVLIINVSNKEKGPRKFDSWYRRIPNVASETRCFFSSVPHSANQGVD